MGRTLVTPAAAGVQQTRTVFGVTRGLPGSKPHRIPVAAQPGRWVPPSYPSCFAAWGGPMPQNA